jgi:hypothetical protein
MKLSASRFSAVVCLLLTHEITRSVGMADIADAQPLFESHCFDCHGNGVAEGNLALDDLLVADNSAAARNQWRKVWKMVRQGFMPPAEIDQPSRADRKAMVQWIEQTPLEVNYDHPDPGRVTMRRLNRLEYEHTVNDLFGLDVKLVENLSSLSQGKEAHLRDLLPPDDTAYGFDNIGDFQTLSPALLEKYFDIAEIVVGKVIVTDGPWYPVQEIDRSSLEVDRNSETKETVHVARFEVTEDGEYQVDIQFYLGGWQEYGGGFDFTLTFDDELLASKTLDVGGQETHRFLRPGKLTAGEHVITFVTTAVKPDSEGKLLNLKLNPKISVTGPISIERKSYPESHQRIFFAGDPPTDAQARRQYAHDILKRVATRAFRRPVDEATLERLTDLAMTEDRFEHGVATGLIAILTSPRFLFRTELQPKPDDPSTVHPLDDYELAARLSYLVWLSLPDDELIKLAEAGELRTNLAEQLRRMLADPKSDRFFEDFAGQWLRTRNVLMTPISRRDEDINPVRSNMKRETEMLFEHIAREDRDLMELVTADYTFLDQRLAEYYGVPEVKGDEFRKVALKTESHRGGILTHGSFLVSTSNPDRTSPVKRGLFVLENLLATQPPAPPANVPALEDAKVEGKEHATVREQLEVHRTDPACAACHAHFDPIGIVLENYDVVGQWREQENDAPIDPSARTVTGAELAGIDDLRNYIEENRERFYRCVTEKLMTYALGRGLEPYDAVTVDRITESLLAEGGRFSTLIAKIVESPSFQMRRGDDDSELDAAALAAIPDIPPPEKRRPDPRRRRRFDRERNEERKDRQKEPEAKIAVPDEREKSP